MINEQTLSVFDVVMRFLDGGGYVVIAKSEIQKRLPQNLSFTEMDDCINALQTCEFIRIRYMDKEVYCLTVLPKGVTASDKRKAAKAAREEAEEEERKERENSKHLSVVSAQSNNDKTLSGGDFKKLAFICGLSGFAGAFIAGIITLIIVLVTK